MLLVIEIEIETDRSRSRSRCIYIERDVYRLSVYYLSVYYLFALVLFVAAGADSARSAWRTAGKTRTRG